MNKVKNILVLQSRIEIMVSVTGFLSVGFISRPGRTRNRVGNDQLSFHVRMIFSGFDNIYFFQIFQIRIKDIV